MRCFCIGGGPCVEISNFIAVFLFNGFTNVPMVNCTWSMRKYANKTDKQSGKNVSSCGRYHPKQLIKP